MIKTDTDWLKLSLTPDLTEARQYLDSRQLTTQFAAVNKMIDFIEQDRAQLWPENAEIVVGVHEKTAVELLKSVHRMLRRIDAENYMGELLTKLHIVCAHLMLLMNGDDMSAHPVLAKGLLFAADPSKRPRWPLAVKFGVGKFWFVRMLHAPGDPTKPLLSTIDLSKVDYDSIRMRAGPCQNDQIEWECYSIEKQMADILVEIGVNPLVQPIAT